LTLIGNSLLHTAVKHNKVKIVRTLISRGADISLINNDGKKALEIVSNPEIRNMILQAAKPKFSIFSSTQTSSNRSLSMVIPKRNKLKRHKTEENKENIHTNSTQTTLNFFQPQTTPIPLTTQYNSSLTSNPKKRKPSDMNHS
jgi:predicted Fe-Mo cluster-binding NifX family protein